jgi:hypothetical protein
MNNDFDHRYDDLLDHPRFEPRRHPRMPMADRAAQFAPFAALTGFKELLDRVAATHLASQPSMYTSPDPDLAPDLAPDTDPTLAPEPSSDTHDLDPDSPDPGPTPSGGSSPDPA